MGTLAATRKTDRSKYLAAKNAQKEAVSWSGEMDDGTGRRIIVLKHMYSLEEATSEGSDFYKELADEIQEECAKIGQVMKVTPIQRHKQGIVCVKFKTSSEAEECIRVMDGRFFAGRTVEASFYDGRSDLRALGITSTSAANSQVAVTPDAAPLEQAAVAATSPELAQQSSAESKGDSGPSVKDTEQAATTATAENSGGASWDDWLNNQSSDSDDEFAIQTEA